MADESQKNSLSLSLSLNQERPKSVESSILDIYGDGVALLNAGLVFGIFIISCCIQPSAPRLFSGVLFSVASMSLILMDSILTDYMLYMASALASVLVMILLSASVLVSSVVLTLHKICLAAILLNFGGYLIYELGFTYLAYNLSFTLLYIITILTLIKKDGRSDARGFGSNSWRSTFSYNFRSWSTLVLKGKK